MNLHWCNKQAIIRGNNCMGIMVDKILSMPNSGNVWLLGSKNSGTAGVRLKNIKDKGWKVRYLINNAIQHVYDKFQEERHNKDTALRQKG